MIKFKISEHYGIEGEKVVEITRDGMLLAAVYKHEPDTIRLISSHVKEVHRDAGIPKVWEFKFE